MFNLNTPHRRFRAATAHLLASAVVAAVVSAWVFFVWYPKPYAAVAGGLSLFLLLVGVDLVLGPALTAVVASPSKPMAELWRDLALIVTVQLAGFGYGLYTIALARPVHLAFEVDRLRVVTAADVEPSSLPAAPQPLRELPWFGPTLIAAVKPTNPAEQMKAVELGLAGIDLSMVPANWRDFSEVREEALRRSRPVAKLLAEYPELADEVGLAAAKAGLKVDTLRFLPLVSRQASWTALVAAPEVRIVGYLPVDAFFR